MISITLEYVEIRFVLFLQPNVLLKYNSEADTLNISYLWSIDLLQILNKADAKQSRSEADTKQFIFTIYRSALDTKQSRSEADTKQFIFTIYRFVTIAY
jgi:hypothetical protein